MVTVWAACRWSFSSRYVELFHIFPLRRLSGIPPLSVTSISHTGQVASDLEPIDLLHLSRTSGWLRAILMSKRSLKLWKLAMGKVIRTSIPPLPEGLNEPTYTALVFDNHCFVSRLGALDLNLSSSYLTNLITQACGVTDAYAVDYALRVRFCDGCFEEKYVVRFAVASKSSYNKTSAVSLRDPKCWETFHRL